MEFHRIDAPNSLRGNQRRAVNILSLEMAFLLGANFQSALQGAVVLNAVIDRSRLLGYVAEPVERQAVLARSARQRSNNCGRERGSSLARRVWSVATLDAAADCSPLAANCCSICAPFGEMSTQFGWHACDFAVVLGKLFFV